MSFDGNSELELVPALTWHAQYSGAWFQSEYNKVRALLELSGEFAQNWERALIECGSHKSEQSLLGDSIRDLPTLRSISKIVKTTAESPRTAVEEDAPLRRLICALQNLVLRLRYECTFRQLAERLSVRLREFELRTCAHVAAELWGELQEINKNVTGKKATRFLDTFIPSAEGELREFCRFASSADPDTIKRVETKYLGRSRYPHKDGNVNEDEVLTKLLFLFRGAVKVGNLALKGVPRSISAVTTTNGRRNVLKGVGSGMD